MWVNNKQYMGENQKIFFKQKNLRGTDFNKFQKIQGSHEYYTKQL